MSRKKKTRRKRYTYEHPENGKKVSRQRIWQLKQKSANRCIGCGRVSREYRCTRCKANHLNRQRKYA